MNEISQCYPYPYMTFLTSVANTNDSAGHSA